MAARKAVLADKQEIAAMCALLWPETSAEEHEVEVGAMLESGMSGVLPGRWFVSQGDDGILAGFVHIGLRSHADGCDRARPVGFIEGWYVQEPLRGLGIGRELMRVAELWAMEQGCLEMGSDSWIDHRDAEWAHKSLGFEVVDRCIHYRKPLTVRTADGNRRVAYRPGKSSDRREHRKE